MRPLQVRFMGAEVVCGTQANTSLPRIASERGDTLRPPRTLFVQGVVKALLLCKKQLRSLMGRSCASGLSALYPIDCKVNLTKFSTSTNEVLYENTS